MLSQTVPRIETFGVGGLSNRRLHLLDATNPEEVCETSFDFARHSAVILAWNATDASSDEVSLVAKTLLDQGAVSISCWGADCKRVHQILMETIAGPSETSPYSSAVMATWHARESFEQVLWYGLFVSEPADPFENSCDDSLVLLIDERGLADAAREALADPEGFSQTVLKGSD
jgi:hypothetical protein